MLIPSTIQLIRNIENRKQASDFLKERLYHADFIELAKEVVNQIQKLENKYPYLSPNLIEFIEWTHEQENFTKDAINKVNGAWITAWLNKYSDDSKTTAQLFEYYLENVKGK